MDALVKINVDGELIKAGSALLRELGVSGLVSSLTGLATDQLDAARSARLVRFYDKVIADRSARRIDGKPEIPDSLLMPAMRAVIDEDDDEMLALWASLVARADQSDESSEDRKVFIRVLSGMVSRDVKLLAYLCGHEAAASRPEPIDEDEMPLGAEEHCVSVGRTAHRLGYSKEAIMISADNLSRMACLQSTGPDSIITAEDRWRIIVAIKYVGCPLFSPTAIYYPTALAFALLKALDALSDPPIQSDRRPQPN